MTANGPQCRKCSAAAELARHHSRSSKRGLTAQASYAVVSGVAIGILMTSLPLWLAVVGAVVAGLAVVFGYRALSRQFPRGARYSSIVLLVAPLVVGGVLTDTLNASLFFAGLIIAAVIVNMPGDTAVEARPSMFHRRGGDVNNALAMLSDVSQNWRDLLAALAVLLTSLYVVFLLYHGVHTRQHPEDDRTTIQRINGTLRRR